MVGNLEGDGGKRLHGATAGQAQVDFVGVVIEMIDNLEYQIVREIEKVGCRWLQNRFMYLCSSISLCFDDNLAGDEDCGYLRWQAHRTISSSLLQLFYPLPDVSSAFSSFLG